MNVRFHSACEREALKAAFWYDDQKLGLGSDFLAEVDQAWKAIGNDPARYPIVEVPRSKREIRCHQVQGYPYAVYFEVRSDEILILAVAHTARRPFYWRRRK